MRIVILYLILITASVQAQTSIEYFNDSENKTGSRIYSHKLYKNTIIAGLQSFEKNKFYPVLVRLDTLGNTLWNSGNTDTSYYNPPFSGPYIYVEDFIIGSDDFIYAIAADFTNTKREIWKVDIENGNILWKVNYNFGFNGNFPPRTIIDYDSTKFIIAYPTSYNGSVYNTRFAFIDKWTGSVITSHFIGNLPWGNFRYGLTIDNQKDIFYTSKDSVFKVSNLNPDSIIWSTTYPSIQIDDYHHIYFDSLTSSIFVMGKESGTEHGKILKVNAFNGVLDSVSTYPYGDVAFRGLQRQDNYLYVLWSGLYSGSNGYYCTKYNMTTGGIDWNFIYTFNGGGANTANSVDIDNSGDVYLNGRYGPYANWGLIKINGLTGNVIYTTNITEDSLKNDNVSWGSGVYVINNTPYLIGDLQTDTIPYPTSKCAFIKLHPLTGNVLLKKYFGGDHKFSANTLYIENYPPDKTIAVKQMGRMIKMEMYDINNNILWEKILKKEYFLKGGNLAIDNNGDIHFSAYTNKDSSSAPFYTSVADSMYVFHLNSNGDILNTNSFFLGSTNVHPYSLFSDLFGTFIFYRKNNVIFYRRIQFNNVSQEFSTLITYSQFIYHPVISRQKFHEDKNAGYAYIFGYRNGANRIIELDKGLMTMTDVGNLPAIMRHVNHVQRLNATDIVMCGRSGANRETMIRYNTTIMDTVWSKQLSNNLSSQVVKFIFDTPKNNLFSVSTSNKNIIVRKISVNTGIPVWETVLDTATTTHEYALDIDINENKGYIIIGGYQVLSSGDVNPVSYILDLAGNIISNHSLTSDSFIFSNWSHTSCVHKLYDGSFWTGGTVNDDTLVMAGFILKTDSLFIIPTIITSQPADTSLCAGNTINLSLTASGINLTYQWRKNGNNITGANSSSLTINSASISDAGLYDVIIISSGGDTVISSTALVVINDLPGSIGLISGVSKVCNYTAYNYSIPAVLNATNYIWIVPPGAQIISGVNTNNIKVKFSNLNGNIEVIADNTCGNSNSVILPIQVKKCVTYNNNINSTLRVKSENDSDLLIFPNPANSQVFVGFTIETETLVNILLHDALGKTVHARNYHSGIGFNQLTLNVFDLKSGIYFVEIRIENETLRKKVTIIN